MADQETSPFFNNVFDGWSHSFSSQQQDPHSKQNRRFSYDSYYTCTESDDESTDSLDENNTRPKRKNSVKVGRQVLSELLESRNVANAIQILKEALDHLNMKYQGKAVSQDICKVYSNILKSLCDPQIAEIVNEMSKSQNGHVPKVEESIMWRLFNKVIESGHVLERDANLAVVDTLIENRKIDLALQAMYALPRIDWDTRCYHAAVLLHLIHDPMQVQEAQGLVLDYGKPFLEIANPIAPNDLPPIRMPMPLMKDITDQDRNELLEFYQDTLEANDKAWYAIRVRYETTREENIQKLEVLEEGLAEWALTQLTRTETTKQQLDRISTENDNRMIQVATEHHQYIYGWRVYEAMGDAVNENTPYAIMHMCWIAFDKTPSVDISRRSHWERHAFSVYSRFMCSEYLHPEQKDTVDFLHDILSIVSQSPEIVIDKKARITKAMSIYQLLVRFDLDTLLCDERVLDPILCTLLSYNHYQDVYNKSFDIWKRKLFIDNKRKKRASTSYSMLWGLLILCLRVGKIEDFNRVIQCLFAKEDDKVPSSLLAPIQIFHDTYLCNECYFQGYMFQFIEYTDDENATLPIFMDQCGFVYPEGLMPNINEVQAKSFSSSVLMGKQQEASVPREMFYSTKKAKALIRHCLMKSKEKVKR